MSMERLTGRKEDGHAYVIGCPEFEVPKEANTVLQSVADKCADLEDILCDIYDLDRLRELVEADKDGRCVVLPCEVCDTVYILNKVFDGKEIKNTIEKRIVDKFIINRLKNTFYESSKPFVLHFNLCDFGKTVFLSRESAEVALAKEATHE